MFLVPLIATAFAVSELVATVIVTVGALAATVGVGLLTSSRPQSVSEETQAARGTELDVKYGGSLPRQAQMGRGAQAGHLIYTNVADVGPSLPNQLLQCVFVLGDGLHGKMLRMWYNGKQITLPADLGTSYYAVPEFIDPQTSGIKVAIAYYKGSYDQAADANLISKANPAGRWTANHRGRGVAYIIVDQIYNEDMDLTSLPDILCETEGLMLYDPRKDDTNGGSGPHRWGQVNTYEPSDNPAIQEYNFRRGITVNGVRILGMTVSVANLLNDMYFAAANDCDEQVSLAAGGNEARYRCGVTISDDRPASDALAVINAAMAGMSVERGGRFGPIAGVEQVVQTSLEFTDDDLLVGQRKSFTKWRTRSELVTAVHGRFSDPAQKWQAVAFDARENAIDDAIIGERINREIDLTQVFSATQAQRLAEIERRRTLQLGKGTVTLPIRWIAATPGDWIRYNSARHGDMTILVTGMSLQQDMSVVLSFDKIATSVYHWEVGDQGIDVGFGPLPNAPTLINQLTGVTAAGVSIPGNNGVIVPAIRFEWVPVFDPSVVQANFEVRVQASPTQVLRFDFNFPAGGLGIAAAGIQANTLYEYRYKVTTFPERATVFSAWFTVTSGTLQSVLQTQTVANGGVTAEALAVGAVVEQALADAAVTAAKLHDDAVTATKFAAGIEPVSIVSTLPNPVGYTGPLTVFLTTDKKLYRYDAAIPAWTKAVDGADITANSITAGQIQAGAIGADQIAANAITASKILAGTISADKLAIGNNANMIQNSDGLGITSSSGGAIIGSTVQFFFSPSPNDYGRRSEGDAFNPPGHRTMYIHWAGSPSGFGEIRWVRPLVSGFVYQFPVTPGKRMEFSCYIATLRCSALIEVVWQNSSGGTVGTSTGQTITTSGNGTLDQWARSFGFATVPAGAAFAKVAVIATLNGQNDPFVFAVAPYFGIANANQTVPSDWHPNGAVVIDGGSIVASSITAGKLSANSVVADNIQALAITTGKLAAGSIYANDLFVDNVVVRGKIQADTSTRVDATQVGFQQHNLDGGLHYITGLGVNSIGGQYIIDFSTNANWGFGFVFLTSGPYDARLFGFTLNLYIDGGFQQSALVNAIFDGVSFANNVVVGVRASIRGHFRGLRQVFLSPGFHVVEIYFQSISSPGSFVGLDQSNIVCFEARR